MYVSLKCKLRENYEISLALLSFTFSMYCASIYENVMFPQVRREKKKSVQKHFPTVKEISSNFIIVYFTMCSLGRSMDPH